MKKSQRIKTIVEIKAAQEKEALVLVGTVQQKLSAMQIQIENLKNYRREYKAKLCQLESEGAKIAHLLEFRAFIDKLDQAILGQELALKSIEAELIEKRKIWESLHLRTNSLQKVCDAAVAEEIKREDKAEQSVLDERASRMGRNNSGGIQY